MDYKNIFSFDIKWSSKTVSLFIFLLILPNFLGMINLSTKTGFKIHFFQYAVFLAAIIYGPKGGLLSGFVGSTYSAFIMHNPYIAVGNAILGFFTGLFIRYGSKTILAVLLAYIIQLPWLILTDYFLVHLPMSFIMPLIMALFFSNIVWAIAAHYTAKLVK
ncbi:hypothetical protein GF323_03620 [Candidatus Woesearchaeota archaeon]|nr:hypothetical protein [Candidatus Woesearchaeota archaeon]